MNQTAELPLVSKLADLSATLRMLVLERRKSEADLNVEELQRAGFKCEARIIAQRSDFIAQLEHFRYDVVISTHGLQGWTGIEALEILRQSGNEVPFIFVSEPVGEEAVVECFRRGATDYIMKAHRTQLPQSMRRALEAKAIRKSHILMVQALHASEGSSQFLFSRNPVPMCIFDVETLDFLDMNHAAIAHYGFERNELLQMRVSDLHPPDEIPRLLASVREIAGGMQTPQKWHHSRKNGSVIDVELYFQAIEYAGRSASMLVVQDFTHRRALEEQLQQAQKFEVIGKLSGRAAHDFNNAVGAILGWAEIGEERSGSIDEKLAVYFRKIHTQCDRVTTLIGQLLAFSRHQSTEPTTLDLNQCIRDSMNFLSRLIGADVDVNIRLGENLNPVRVDPAQIEQALVSLCVLARDAMPHGGRLSIESKNANLPEQDGVARTTPRAGPHVTVSVSYSGIRSEVDVALPPAVQQVDGDEVDSHTALDLRGVRRILEQHGGFLDVERAEPNGHAFHIFVPAWQNPEADGAQTAGASLHTHAGNETVLIAEDHDGMRDMACTLLQSLGHTVLVASDGRQAIEIFSSRCNEIDLVLLNVTMPHCGGLEAYEVIKRLKPDVPILLSTGHSASNPALKNLSAAGIPILQKPFLPSMFCRLVRQALDRKANSQPDATQFGPI